MDYEKKVINDELSSINFVLNERTFRENLFRTKVKLQRSELESKLELITELLTTINTSYK